MRTLKPAGYYSERLHPGTSRKECYWLWNNVMLRKGETLRFGALLITILDVTPSGLIIDYKSLGEDS